jgi:hypothetical protein
VTTALDQFEQALVDASHRLARPPGATSDGSVNRLSAPGRLFRRVRRLSVALQLGLAVTAVSALAGGGIAGFLLSRENNRTGQLAAFECATTRHGSVGISAVTGDPIIDCAANWPQASGGQSTAPPLTAWRTTVGKEVALVQPTSWGRPPRSRYWRWQRLPVGWTVDFGVVDLTDQLGNISFDSGPCAYAGRTVQAVLSLLRADNLASWSVTVAPNSARPVSSACRPLIPNVAGVTRSVQLIQLPAPAKLRLGQVPPQRVQTLLRESRAAHRKLATLYADVNGILASRCATVSAAATLWTRIARAAGFRPTSLAFWRAANARNGLPPARFFDHYTLFKQPASQPTGTCAHVLVMVVPGSGIANVYAARIKP